MLHLPDPVIRLKPGPGEDRRQIGSNHPALSGLYCPACPVNQHQVVSPVDGYGCPSLILPGIERQQVPVPAVNTRFDRGVM